jgi:MFS family permease
LPNNANAPVSRPLLSTGIIILGSFIAPLLVHSSTLAIPAIARELALDARTISWFTMTLVIGNVSFMLPAARLGDRFGRKRLFVLGMLLAASASLLGAMAQSSPALMACRFLQGMGNAIIFGNGLALINGITPIGKRGRVTGIYAAFCYLGIVSGPLMGGYVIDHLSWRMVFFLPVPFLLLASLVGAVSLKWERFGKRGTRFDMSGSILYTLAILALAPGVQNINTLTGQLMIALGLALLAGFCWQQMVKTDPLIELGLFVRNRLFGFSCLATLFIYVGLFSLPFIITLYLQYIKAISAQAAGLILISQAIFTALVAPLSGLLSERYPSHHIAISGALIITSGLLLLCRIDAGSNLFEVVAALCLIGVGAGLIDTPIIHAALATVTLENLGSASAAINTMRMMGGFISIGIISALLNIQIGGALITPDVYDELLAVVHWYFFLSIASALCAAVCLYWGFQNRPTVSV